MATEANLEALNDAYTVVLFLPDFMVSPDPRGHIRAHNILLDAAIDCGMPHDHNDYVGWAGERITQWLLSGPLDLAA